MAGIILVIMGLLKFGNLIRFIPYTITTGFTFGIAVTIVIGQIKDFLGLTYPAGTATVESMDKLKAIIANIGTFNIKALIVGAVSLAILIIWPKFKSLDKIPPSLIAVIVSVLMVKFIGPLKDVNTIGSLYTIKKGLPGVSVPSVNMDMILTLLPDALTIAVLAGIESLLSCVVSDGMIGSRHKSNMELVAQGAGNIVSALFGGIPATGAIARTAANVKNGGRTPIAGMVHSVTLLIVLVVLMPYAAWIPMPAIAAILFIVAYNMSGWREMVNLVKHSPKSDTLVLLTTMVLTVVFDLVVAIEVGIVMAALLFLLRMADVTEVRSWKYIGVFIDEFNDPDEFLRLANETVPFLNGGLFDCLDEKRTGMYYDGFSERKETMAQLIVPDYLFYGEEAGKNIDLSDFYGDANKKKVSARGIIDILKRYNFTVEENMPFDKDVSLDPELLGKVFENL